MTVKERETESTEENAKEREDNAGERGTMRNDEDGTMDETQTQSHDLRSIEEPFDSVKNVEGSVVVRYGEIEKMKEARLGLGPGRGPNEGGGLSVPSKVKALTVPVASVSCGGFFTMALTQEGQLWNWGANSNYELGRGDNLGGWEPIPVPSLEGVRITQIACGGYHSLALTEEGKVLSWGHGGHGQLGNASLRNQQVPTEIEALADKKIVFIACGGSSSAAITDGGELWMWGNAKDFQLGVPGLPEIQTCPVQVNFLTEEDELGPHKVISVSIGASHALCLVSRSH
ncbi:hypothetical protein F2Q68_00036858 [Brassica cretica]|uniref:RCC1-like domain-containing protein n=1 Tax=Brassica cretica TaxID=69181 RepID=A0A8S9H848_BRACR|nr:hypothetical protein F2Q68_00036858 [Brassica cretica]